MPSRLWSHGIAPGRIPPLNRLPATRSKPSLQALDEGLEIGEVVAVVGVAHDHPAAARGGDPACQRRTVAASFDRDDARSELLGDLLRAVGGSVVGHDDLAGDADALERVERLLDADADRARLIQARHDHRELRGNVLEGRPGWLRGNRHYVS